jgi:hypothetical protein
MNLPRTVAEVLRNHVTLELEGIDRLYLNAYVPMLQTEGGVAYFFRQQHHKPFVSGALMAPIGEAFVKQVGEFATKRAGRCGPRRQSTTRATFASASD